MSVYAGELQFVFEPKMAINATAVAETKTPAGLAVKLKTLASLSYVQPVFKYLLRLNQATAGGTANINLYAGATVVGQIANVDLSTATEFSGSLDVDLSSVAGSTPITAAVDITGAADAGTTATLDAALDIDLPIINTSC